MHTKEGTFKKALCTVLDTWGYMEILIMSTACVRLCQPLYTSRDKFLPSNGLICRGEVAHRWFTLDLQAFL